MRLMRLRLAFERSLKFSPTRLRHSNSSLAVLTFANSRRVAVTGIFPAAIFAICRADIRRRLHQSKISHWRPKRTRSFSSPCPPNEPMRRLCLRGFVCAEGDHTSFSQWQRVRQPRRAAARIYGHPALQRIAGRQQDYGDTDGQRRHQRAVRGDGRGCNAAARSRTGEAAQLAADDLGNRLLRTDHAGGRRAHRPRWRCPRTAEGNHRTSIGCQRRSGTLCPVRSDGAAAGREEYGTALRRAN